MDGRLPRDVEVVEAWLRERAHELAHAVGAKVEADHGIAVAHGADRRSVVRDHDGGQELIGLAAVPYAARTTAIGSLLVGPTPSTTRPVEELGARPTLVPIHPKVSAAHRRDARSPLGPAHELSHEAESGLRRCIAAIEQRVHPCARRALRLGEIE